MSSSTRKNATKNSKKKPKKTKTKSKKDFDLKSWAKNATKAKKSRRRQSETLKFPEVCAAIEEVLTMMANGEISIAGNQLHEMLVEEYDYPLTEAAMMNYIYSHHKELWGRRNG